MTLKRPNRFIEMLRENGEIPLFYSSNSDRGDVLPIDDSHIRVEEEESQSEYWLNYRRN